ncbi:hypothetical protein [Candidatus Uabimicrobium amorphum]|uniref:Uncharacterized protein n=1 Tax=Uabimicrobium amorphum TaxID=2596890 RepID=A0A5S9IS15_UABAM|nr:hypothetical protein [Candidatus Uabimicrobium amorphum]BBM86481.1 hypothetical protein UABAM_04867 [Candidatus Uabimicrobium amorphum]
MHFSQKRGTAIVIVLIILSSLSFLSIFFVRIAMRSRLASENYTLRTLAQLTAYAGIDHCLANTFHELVSGNIIDAPTMKKQRKNITGVHKGIGGTTGYVIGKNRMGNYALDGNVYTTKMTSEMAKFNVNGYVAVRAKYQLHSNETLYRILHTLAKTCKCDDAKQIAQLIAHHHIKNNQRFYCHEHLRTFLQKHFANSPQLQRFVSLLSVSPKRQKCFAALAQGVYYEEWRCAVDVNNISRELLYALIFNIKATANFHDVQVQTNDRGALRSLREKMQQCTVDFSDDAVNVYEIVDYIQNRVAFTGPFTHFMEFAQFVESLPKQFFPTCPVNIRPSFWRQMWRDALKSNFTRDVVDNNCNPNSPMYVSVAKQNLCVKKDNQFFCGHTAELLFFHCGPFVVRAQAHINTHNQCVARARQMMEVVWGKTLVHSTQKDFQTMNAQQQETLSVGSCSSSLLRKYCGFVEPKPRKMPKGLFTLSSYPDDIHTQMSYFGGVYNDDGTVFTKKSKLSSRKLISSLREGVNHLHHDGLVSSQAYYRNRSDNDHYITHAITPQSATEDLRGCNTISSSHIANYNGSIELWIKLNETPGNVRFPGPHFMLMACTTKNRLRFVDDTQQHKFHEGTQMLLYIDSFGYLRFSRQHYTRTFTLDKRRKIVEYGVSSQHRDPRRGFTHRHIEVNVANLGWRAHEWHHIIVRWHDEKRIVTLEVDGYTPQEAFVEEKNAMAILNEVDPRDVLFINGYHRYQATNTGYFPFTRTVNLFGNATIDKFISYDDHLEAQYKSRYLNNSRYNNAFIVNGKYIRGPLYWNSYIKGEGDYTQQTTVEVFSNNVLHKNNMLIPKNTMMANRMEYSVRFHCGKKRNLSIECPALGMICQVVLFTYPKVNKHY